MAAVQTEPSRQDPDLETLDRDGYIVLSNILDPAKVERARQRFEELFQQDVESRRQRNVREARDTDGPVGQTILSPASHLMLNVFGKNPAFDELVEQLLGDQRVLKWIEAWSGPHFKIDSCNIRYMTGAYDPPPAHELHRDGKGSMNLGIMLSDVEPGDNAATALVPGSHRFPTCPRWDTLFSEPFRLRKDPGRSGLPCFLRWNLFSRWLRRCVPKTTGAFGKCGSVYFMGNGEVWHGRLPNVHGRRTMICLIGLNGVDAEIAQRKPPVPAEVIAKLPPRLARAVGGPFELNDAHHSILDRLYQEPRSPSLFSLFFWARLERRVCEWISDKLAPGTNSPAPLLGRIAALPRRGWAALRSVFRRLLAPLSH